MGELIDDPFIFDGEFIKHIAGAIRSAWVEKHQPGSSFQRSEKRDAVHDDGLRVDGGGGRRGFPPHHASPTNWPK
jgi:hypothetical protein